MFRSDSHRRPCMAVQVTLVEATFPQSGWYVKRSNASETRKLCQDFATLLEKAGYSGTFSIRHLTALKGGPDHQGKITVANPHRYHLEIKIQPGDNTSCARVALASSNPRFTPQEMREKLIIAQEEMARERLQAKADEGARRRENEKPPVPKVGTPALRPAVVQGSANLRLVSSQSGEQVEARVEQDVQPAKISYGSLRARLEKLQSFLKDAEESDQRLPVIDRRLAEIENLYVALADEQSALTAERAEILEKRSKFDSLESVEAEATDIESKLRQNR